MAVKWANAHFTNGQKPIMLGAMLSELITAIDAHLAWRKARGHELAETTFGRFAANDGKLMGRLRAGKGITVATMQAIQAWIAADRAEIEKASPARQAAA